MRYKDVRHQGHFSLLFYKSIGKTPLQEDTPASARGMLSCKFTIFSALSPFFCSFFCKKRQFAYYFSRKSSASCILPIIFCPLFHTYPFPTLSQEGSKTTMTILQTAPTYYFAPKHSFLLKKYLIEHFPWNFEKKWLHSPNHFFQPIDHYGSTLTLCLATSTVCTHRAPNNARRKCGSSRCRTP